MTIDRVTGGKGAICAEVLATLPDWFGIAESNAAYVRAVETMAMFAARDGGETLGFVAVERRTQFAFEIHVVGVKPSRHRSGLGHALVEAAAAHARGEGARFLTVKTLAPSHPDPGYVKTRAFYAAEGFLPLEEFPTLWNPDNPALMLLRVL